MAGSCGRLLQAGELHSLLTWLVCYNILLGWLANCPRCRGCKGDLQVQIRHATGKRIIQSTQCHCGNVVGDSHCVACTSLLCLKVQF
jgi:hypothetical protein